jgi:hypothetical protein
VLEALIENAAQYTGDGKIDEFFALAAVNG